MTNEELLNEALECIYEIRGAYLDNKFPEYERHNAEIKHGYHENHGSIRPL